MEYFQNKRCDILFKTAVELKITKHTKDIRQAS